MQCRGGCMQNTKEGGEIDDAGGGGGGGGRG